MVETIGYDVSPLWGLYSAIRLTIWAFCRFSGQQYQTIAPQGRPYAGFPFRAVGAESARNSVRDDGFNGFLSIFAGRRNGEIEYPDGNKACANGNKELSDGNKACANGNKELPDGNKACANGNKELPDGNKACANGNKELPDGNKACANGNKELPDGLRIKTVSKQLIT